MADAHIPDKPALEGLEAKWSEKWEADGTFLFDRLRAAEVGRAGIYSVDTPPPTASGSLHIGHVFSYTHTDIKVRYERMTGKTVFYPMGWDDNGLPTERRVQNYYGVRCDPSLPYDAGFTPPYEGGDNKSSRAADQIAISRRNFIELCERLTVEDEKAFEALWRGARPERGLDADLSHDLGRDDPHVAARVPPRAGAGRGVPVARADALGHRLPLRDRPGRARGPRPAGGVPPHRLPRPRDDVFIETTRPELLAACVALVAHPDDERYQPLFGSTVRTPIFDVEVPVWRTTSPSPTRARASP